MNFHWTGIAHDSRTGKTRRTGFEVTLWGFRFHTFETPTGTFGKRGRRFVFDIGPLHAMITWDPYR